MTFATHKDTPGRLAANVLELDLDYCTRSYGVSPCVATLALRNDLNHSEQLDIAESGGTPGWVNTFITANTINGPEGTLTADLLARTISSAQEVFTYQNRTIGLSIMPDNTVVVVSCRIKPKIVGGVPSERFVELNYFSSLAEFNFARFDIIDGIYLGGGNFTDTTFISADIRPVRNTTETGWFRIWMIFDTKVAPGTNQVGIHIIDSAFNHTTTGDIGDGVHIHGFQERPLTDVGVASTYDGLGQPGKYAARVTAVVDGMGVIDDLCFNSFFTCQDTPNYFKEVRTLRFIDTLVRPFQFLDAYPAILSVRYAPTVLKPGGNLSIRGKVTVVLQDFATTDNEIDDYPHERTYNTEDRGTFFGKLKARHRFYIGRPMRVKEGYLDDADIADFRTREYIIDDISGPTADGKVTITGKDILSLAADIRAKAPTASTNTLRAAMDTTQTTLLPQIGEAVTMLAGDKHVRINDEIIELTSESPTDTLNVVRGRGGTVGVAHAIDDGIQECKTYENTPVIDVVQELLQTFANVPASFIPFTDWELEETETLSGYDVETIISEPTGVLTLLKEIAAITLLDIWYDDVDQEIKLKLQTPFTSVSETVNDTQDILADTLKVKDLNNQRLTRVLIYYGMRNFARDLTETENFSLINFEIEADKEGVNKYNDERIKVIFSRWFDLSNKVQVQLTSTRLLDRFGITPKAIQFDLDAKDVDRLKTGDVFDLTSRIEQAIDGTNATNRYQVTETKAIRPGSHYKYKCEAFFQDPTPDTLTISTNQINFDLFVALGGPPGPVDVTLTINTGVDVDGAGASPALTTVGMHPDSTLKIINNGEIRGYGGAGGAGTNANVISFFIFFCRFLNTLTGGAVGLGGGDALNTTIDVTIDNTNGNIFGGAGGGGGGGMHSLGNTAFGGGGGGGGIGTDTAAGALGGTADASGVTCGGPGVDGDGVAGAGGTTSAAGAGGLKGGTSAGDGGNGGADWGDNGLVGGSDGAGSSDGFSGGVGGFAVRLNGSSIIFEGGNNPTQVKGSVA